MYNRRLRWRIRCFLEDQAAEFGSRISRSRPARWMARQPAVVFVARILLIVRCFVANWIWWPVKRLARRGRKFMAAHEVWAWLTTWAVCVGLAEAIILPTYTGYLKVAEGLLATTAFVIIGFRSPLTGLLLWLGTSPLLNVYLRFQFLRGTPIITGSRVCVGILLVVFLMHAKRESRTEKNFLLHACMVLFIVAMLIASVPAVNPKSTVQMVLDSYMMPMLVYLFARRWVSDRRSLSIAFIILICVGVYFSALAIPEHFTGKNWFTISGRPAWIEEELETVRVQGPADSPTEFGSTVIVAMMLVLVKLAYEPRSGKRFLYAAALTLMTIGICLTLRRAVYVGVVMAFLGLLLAAPKPRKLAGTILAVSAVVLLVSWQSLVNSKLYSVRIKDVKPLYSRAVTQATTLNMIKHRPILGFGVDNFMTAKKDYLVPYKDIAYSYGRGVSTPHNSYMRIMVEGGIVAFLPFFGMITLMLATSIRAWRRCREGGLLGRDGIVVFWTFSAVYLAQSFQGDTFWYCNYISALWFFFFGAVVGVHMQKPLEPVPERQRRRASLSRLSSPTLPVRR